MSQGSDSMITPTKNYSLDSLGRDILWFFFCSSIPLVLFDNRGLSKRLNTLFLLNSHLCSIAVINLFLVLIQHGPTNICFTTMEAEGEDWIQ